MKLKYEAIDETSIIVKGEVNNEDELLSLFVRFLAALERNGVCSGDLVEKIGSLSSEQQQ